VETTGRSQLTDPAAIRLAPLPVWKWSIAIVFLLLMPLLILVQQASEAFNSSAELARSEIGQQLEGLSSRIALEMSTSMQLREILNDFKVPYFKSAVELYFLQNFRRQPEKRSCARWFLVSS
jgi:hypothetical protein